jgi:hypothetical protein
LQRAVTALVNKDNRTIEGRLLRSNVEKGLIYEWALRATNSKEDRIDLLFSLLGPRSGKRR